MPVGDAEVVGGGVRVEVPDAEAVAVPDSVGVGVGDVGGRAARTTGGWREPGAILGQGIGGDFGRNCQAKRTKQILETAAIIAAAARLAPTFTVKGLQRDRGGG